MKKDNPKVKKNKAVDAANFTFKYDGSNEIEVDVLIKSLKSVSESLKEISLIETGNEIDIKVKPFKKGSFEILFTLNELYQTGQIPLIAQSIPAVIETFKNMFELVKLFGGEKIKPGKHIGGDNYQFKNNQGEVKVLKVDKSIHTETNDHSTSTTTNNIENHYHGTVYNAPVTIIQQLIVTADHAESITGIKLLDKDRKVIAEAKKAEISNAAKSVTLNRLLAKEKAPKEKRKFLIKKNVYLSVCKPDLAGKTPWKVVFMNNKVDVKIDDLEFLEDVKAKKYSFYNSAKILVDLKINQELDEASNLYINTTYNLVKFHSLIDENAVPSLFDED